MFGNRRKDLFFRNSGTVLNEKVGDILQLRSPRSAPRTLHGNVLLLLYQKVENEECECAIYVMTYRNGGMSGGQGVNVCRSICGLPVLGT